MAKTITLSELRQQVRERADMVNSLFVTDSEITTYINQSASALHDMLVQKFGNDYYLSSSSLSIQSGVDLYSLPADFYKLTGIDVVLSSGRSTPLKRFGWDDRNRAGHAAVGSVNFRYRVQGTQIRLSPTPSANHTAILWYVPTVATLSSGTDVLDGVNGWEEFVVVDAAIKCKEKEESDTRILERQRQRLELRIEEAAENRDAGEPITVRDVYDDLGWF